MLAITRMGPLDISSMLEILGECMMPRCSTQWRWRRGTVGSPLQRVGSQPTNLFCQYLCRGRSTHNVTARSFMRDNSAWQTQVHYCCTIICGLHGNPEVSESALFKVSKSPRLQQQRQRSDMVINEAQEQCGCHGGA